VGNRDTQMASFSEPIKKSADTVHPIKLFQYGKARCGDGAVTFTLI